MAVDGNSKLKRIGLQFAFWGVLAILFGTLMFNFVNFGQPNQLSAYDNDWDDLSAFRQDINDMGIKTKSLVSSPLLLEELEDPRNVTFVIAGVERDTISLPQFSGESVVTFASEDGYSPSEVDAIVDFVIKGGTVIVFEDYGYANTIAEKFGVKFKRAQLYDTVYVHELDYNYIWTCMQLAPCGMNGTVLDPTTIESHSRWNSTDPLSGRHICAVWADLMALNGTTITKDEAGLCAQHHQDGLIRYNASYQMLLNNITSIDIDETNKHSAMITQGIRAVSSSEATIDVNGDGEIWIGSGLNADTPDLWGQFNLSIEVCASVTCSPFEGGGRVHFVADGSTLINAIYDYEGFNRGDYGPVSNEMPANDNRKWALDVIAESLMALDPATGMPLGEASPTAMVIFDESRHVQSNVATDTYNMLYFVLVYFTGEGLAKLLLFIGLFVLFEGVLLKKKDPDPWRHVFSIIYYGFGDANRYSYYAKNNKIKQVFLSKVRNQNGLTREEFDSMPARELQAMIADPVLVKFVFENKTFTLEQTVAIVKRVKVWGRV